MTTTLSPQSMCGVKVGLCLPRRRMAMIEARRPSTSPSASISSHFFCTSAVLREKVFMGLSSVSGRLWRARRGMSTWLYNLALYQRLKITVLYYPSLRVRRNRVGYRGMSHGILDALAPYREVADGERAAKFHQPSLPDQVGGFGFAHEVDVGVGWEGGGDGPELTQNQEIEAEIDQPHQRWTRDRAAGPQIPLMRRQTHADLGIVEMFDLEIEMRHLGEVLLQEFVQVGGRPHRHDRTPPIS